MNIYISFVNFCLSNLQLDCNIIFKNWKILNFIWRNEKTMGFQSENLLNSEIILSVRLFKVKWLILHTNIDQKILNILTLNILEAGKKVLKLLSEVSRCK